MEVASLCWGRVASGEPLRGSPRDASVDGERNLSGGCAGNEGNGRKVGRSIRSGKMWRQKHACTARIHECTRIDTNQANPPIRVDSCAFVDLQSVCPGVAFRRRVARGL